MPPIHGIDRIRRRVSRRPAYRPSGATIAMLWQQQNLCRPINAVKARRDVPSTHPQSGSCLSAPSHRYGGGPSTFDTHRSAQRAISSVSSNSLSLPVSKHGSLMSQSF